MGYNYILGRRTTYWFLGGRAIIVVLSISVDRLQRGSCNFMSRRVFWMSWRGKRGLDMIGMGITFATTSLDHAILELKGEQGW
jgi:hypothetical protein